MRVCQHSLCWWSFQDFRAAMIVFESPVARYNIVGVFLVMLQTCFYGNQTMVYFVCETLSLHQYLSLDH